MKLILQNIALIILIAITSLFLSGCEGMDNAQGIVVSSETEMPIDSVKVIFTDDGNSTDTTYTDS